MAGIMRNVINPFAKKDMKKEKNFLINCYKALFLAVDAIERDIILFSMLVLAYAHPEGSLYK